jgi:hypothetical protein
VAYVDAIERHLRAGRGAEAVLSPHDFALARTWFAGGLPLATVLRVLDEAADTRPGGVTSLAYVERAVRAAARLSEPRSPAGTAARAATKGRAR